MDFKIGDVSGSTVSKFAFGIMQCCIISYNISLCVHNGDVTSGAYVLMTMAAIVLISWLIWFFYVYIKGKKVRKMPPRPGAVAEGCNWVIFILWILSDFVSIARHPIVGICAWFLFGASVVYYVVYCHRHECS